MLEVTNIFKWNFGFSESLVRIEWDCHNRRWIPIQMEYFCPPDTAFPEVPPAPIEESRVALNWSEEWPVLYQVLYIVVVMKTVQVLLRHPPVLVQALVRRHLHHLLVRHPQVHLVNLPVHLASLQVRLQNHLHRPLVLAQVQALAPVLVRRVRLATVLRLVLHPVLQVQDRAAAVRLVRQYAVVSVSILGQERFG